MTEETTGKEIQLYTRLGEGGRINGLDMRLLEMARQKKTGEQMSEELGGSIPPARCVQRVREIIKAQDLLSVAEQKSLILLDIIKVRDLIMERLGGYETKIGRDGIGVEVETGAPMYNAMIRLFKEWRSLIDSIRDDVDAGNVQIRQAHADIMMEALMAMFRHYSNRLESAGIVVPQALALELLEEVAPIGFNALSQHVSDADAA